MVDANPKTRSTTQRPVVIIGIDPGYDRCGFAVIARDPRGAERVRHSSCLSTERTAPFHERLCAVGTEFSRLCKDYMPDICAIEKVYFTKNQKTAMQVAEVRGALLYLAAAQALTITEYTPNEVKVAIAGDGRADKRQVMYMVERLIALPHTPDHDDEYDALAVALTASARVHARVAR